MNHSSSQPADSISALADGRLSEADAKQVVDHLLVDEEALATWHAYHVVGDVLRSSELAPAGADDLAFLARFEQRMAQETPALVVQATPMQSDRMLESANAAVFRWKVLAGVACMALVGMVGWNQGWAPTHGDAGQVAVAPAAISSAPVVAVVEGDGGNMVRDPQLDALMAAHRQMGGHSALQTPAGYLRNAAFEGARR